MAIALTKVNGKLLKRRGKLGVDANCCHPCYMECGGSEVTQLVVTVAGIPSSFTYDKNGTTYTVTGMDVFNGTHTFTVEDYSTAGVCYSFPVSVSVAGSFTVEDGTNTWTLTNLEVLIGSFAYNCGAWSESFIVTLYGFDVSFGAFEAGYGLAKSGCSYSGNGTYYNQDGECDEELISIDPDTGEPVTEFVNTDGSCDSVLTSGTVTVTAALS